MGRDGITIKAGEFFRIGELAKLAGVTVRTVRYYEELGLLETSKREGGSHRKYSVDDLVHLKRIKQLKSYGLTLSEIKEIIDLSREDPTGQKSRLKLIASYRKKLDEAIGKKQRLEEYIKELEWHIEQLKKVKNFNACPGSECKNCEYREFCEFADMDN